jgi:hypothetical protein
VPETPFPLPASSFGELKKIILGYSKCHAEASLEEVSHSCAMATTVISGSNKFLIAIGLLEGGKRKTLTDLGRELALALDHPQSADVAGAWRKVIVGSEFLQKIVSAVRIRNGMEPSMLRSHVAYTAGQTKNQKTMTGAGAVIELLSEALVIRQVDDKFIASEEVRPAEPESAAPSTSASPKASTVSTDLSVPTGRQTPASGVSFVIQLQVRCRTEDIDSLSPKLKKLIAELGTARTDGAADAVD